MGTASEAYWLVEVGGFSQYKFAWFEPVEGSNYADDHPRCPRCDRAVGGRYWLPPHEVALKQARRIGDMVYGAGGTDMLVSERFRAEYYAARLRGIVEFFPVRVVKVGRRSAPPSEAPRLYGVYFAHSLARADYSRMGVDWMSEPGPDYCRCCGPGGGGSGGCVRSLDRIVLEPDPEPSEDFFYPMNLSGRLLVSARGREFIKAHAFTNVTLIPISQARSRTIPGGQIMPPSGMAQENRVV